MPEAICRLVVDAVFVPVDYVRRPKDPKGFWLCELEDGALEEFVSFGDGLVPEDLIGEWGHRVFGTIFRSHRAEGCCDAC